MGTSGFTGQVRDALDDIGLEDTPWIARGVEAYELSRALLMVLARRYGLELVDDVTAELHRRRDACQGSAVTEDTETSEMLRTATLWHVLDDAEVIARAPASRPS